MRAWSVGGEPDRARWAHRPGGGTEERALAGCEAPATRITPCRHGERGGSSPLASVRVAMGPVSCWPCVQCMERQRCRSRACVRSVSPVVCVLECWSVCNLSSRASQEMNCEAGAAVGQLVEHGSQVALPGRACDAREKRGAGCHGAEITQLTAVSCVISSILVRWRRAHAGTRQ